MIFIKKIVVGDIGMDQITRNIVHLKWNPDPHVGMARLGI